MFKLPHGLNLKTLASAAVLAKVFRFRPWGNLNMVTP